MTGTFAAIRPVIAALDTLGLRYHVGGSFASSLHGVPRHTQDLDLVVELLPARVNRFAALLQDEFYLETEQIHSAIARHGSFNLVHLATGFKIDIFVLGTGMFDASELERSLRMEWSEAFGGPVLVKTAEDTLLRKLQWYRLGNEVSDRQWNDVLGILRTQGERLDLPYLRYWAAELRVSDLLDRAFADVQTDQ